MQPFADHRDLYLLAAGVLFGLLLSPAVLGRVAPELYDRIFVGATAADVQEATDYHAMVRDQIQVLIAEDRPASAVEDHLAALRLNELNPLARMEQLHRERSMVLMGTLCAIMIVIALVMVLETFVSPQQGPDAPQRTRVHPLVGRLKSARYALMAIWLALFLANPVLLWKTPWLFALMLAVVAMVTLVPLGRTDRRPADVA